MIICQVYLCFFGGVGVKAAGVNDFYFDDFTGDYYLSRDEEGVSHLRVRESVTAVFPNFNQNKGICRQIPFTNQDGANITLARLTKNDIVVTRNGKSEPIYSIEKSGSYYNVCTGTEEYVLGRQTYVFEYKYERVVTEFEDYQELYWDTNGNGSQQKFNSVTVRVHLPSGVESGYTGNAWCYVGKYGANGQERCEITQIDDGVKFETHDLAAYENLTFDLEFLLGTFVVPAPRKNYILVWILVVVGLVLSASLYFPIKRYVKTRSKKDFYKKYFVKPEYQPHAEYGVAEMAEVYLGKKKDAKAAVLLDLVVRKKIELKKEGAEKRKGWKIIVKELGGVSNEAKNLLRILGGIGTVNVGDEIELKRRKATEELVRLGRAYDGSVLAALERHELVENGYKVSSTDEFAILNVVFLVFTIMMTVAPICAMIMMDVIEETLGGSLMSTKSVVAMEEFVPIVLVMVLVTVVVWLVLHGKSKKYAVRTVKGLEMSRYMDGAKLYIEMAEAERLKFLQSVQGAEVSSEGIVHLYEKMLPYAAVLGLENSWIKELEKYYQLEGVTEPNWYTEGLTVRDVYYASSLAASMSRSSTTMASSGGGSSGFSSSGSSGGGGGGFSGGGGGGGGFSGR